MDKLTALELAAMRRILAEPGSALVASLAAALDHIRVTSRLNTGGGFFSSLDLSKVNLAIDRGSYGQCVFTHVAGMDFGLGMIFHLRPDDTSLEGYSVGGEETATIDFCNARFAIADEPGRFT